MFFWDLLHFLMGTRIDYLGRRLQKWFGGAVYPGIVTKYDAEERDQGLSIMLTILFTVFILYFEILTKCFHNHIHLLYLLLLKYDAHFIATPQLGQQRSQRSGMFVLMTEMKKIWNCTRWVISSNKSSIRCHSALLPDCAVFRRI